MRIKILLLCVGVISSSFADVFALDLLSSKVQCNNYSITNISTLSEVRSYCKILDTHSGSVRLVRGSETLDIQTSNFGIISCQFNKSLLGSSNTIEKCTTTIPPIGNGAIITIKTRTS